ncbi:solute carrier family 22 member 5-like [Haliotis rubra]|uniref:solute carrier family 22 member 5-like n=1 Tax=Haliotis rubra TaxID=36100 RepID=UPI001EE586F9|nr:solute carrier family 22 member 5-like [Haliotis rubra]
MIIGWMVVMTLTAEQFPTVIRNLACAAQSAAARIGGILASQVLSLGGTKDLMLPFIAMGILVVLNILATIGLEETRGRALEDTMTFTSKSDTDWSEHKSDNLGTPLVSCAMESCDKGKDESDEQTVK